MSTYETMELIASHHAELERLCEEVLELGGRVSGEDQDSEAFHERVRALGWRLRAHRAQESAALIAEAGAERDAVAERLRENPCAEVEQVEEAILRAEREAHAPLELARVVCRAARSCRATLDRLARD